LARRSIHPVATFSLLVPAFATFSLLVLALRAGMRDQRRLTAAGQQDADGPRRGFAALLASTFTVLELGNEKSG
jgi:hypothetical protein